MGSEVPDGEALEAQARRFAIVRHQCPHVSDGDRCPSAQKNSAYLKKTHMIDEFYLQLL
jgi:hypothetical protein